MQFPKKSIACAAIAAGLSGIAYANDAWSPVSNAHLDEMRGGFDAGSGLKVSFGIERTGYVNGNLVSGTSFNVADIARLGAGQMNPVDMTVIHNGANALHANTFSQPAAALVIQNTLNLQDIHSLTVINATANSLEIIKGLNLQSTLTDALAQSLGRR